MFLKQNQISVTNPSFYSERFQKFLFTSVFKKAPRKFIFLLVQQAFAYLINLANLHENDVCKLSYNANLFPLYDCLLNKKVTFSSSILGDNTKKFRTIALLGKRKEKFFDYLCFLVVHLLPPPHIIYLLFVCSFIVQATQYRTIGMSIQRIKFVVHYNFLLHVCLGFLLDHFINIQYEKQKLIKNCCFQLYENRPLNVDQDYRKCYRHLNKKKRQ